MSARSKNVLICPLDWGLGHATRCVPVIKKFVAAGANVILAADKRPLAFLRNEFPNLQHIVLPGYNITYPRHGSMALHMVYTLPGISKSIKKEHAQLQQIIQEYGIDIVISDNRYGLWSKDAYSVFMTHQLHVQCPGWTKIFEPVVLRMTRKFISRYNECWVPDHATGFRLSGKLSESKNIKPDPVFIGTLSRFEDNPKLSDAGSVSRDLLIMLSGPEPQRSILEDIILDQVKALGDMKALLIRGITEGSGEIRQNRDVSIADHMDTESLHQAILKAEVVVCRPGYSSIMDIVSLGRKAIFVPTPGQTEQEYLATYYKKRNFFYSMKQDKFDLATALVKYKFYNGIKKPADNKVLGERVTALLNS